MKRHHYTLSRISSPHCTRWMPFQQVVQKGRSAYCELRYYLDTDPNRPPLVKGELCVTPFGRVRVKLWKNGKQMSEHTVENVPQARRFVDKEIQRLEG